jgi:hypothetical protein
MVVEKQKPDANVHIAEKQRIVEVKNNTEQNIKEKNIKYIIYTIRLYIYYNAFIL